MTFKEYLIQLEWNSFEKYPPQGSSIYLYCCAPHVPYHSFLKIDKFNAVSFKPRSVANKVNAKIKNWVFKWLPAELIKEEDNFE